MTSTASDSPIPLKDGPTVRGSLLVWLLQAEDRGLRLSAASDDLLHLGPRSLVTEADLVFAKANKQALIAAVRYVEEMCRRPL